MQNLTTGHRSINRRDIVHIYCPQSDALVSKIVGFVAESQIVMKPICLS